MTTPELPFELRLPALEGPGQAMPSPANVPSAAAPTPGVSFAGARVPGAPTVPEPELTALVARMASELFAGGAVTAPSAPAAPSSAVPAAAPPHAPFSAPLSFDALSLGSLGDGAALPQFALLDATAAPAASPTAAPTRGEVAPSFASVLGHELVPTNRPSLGAASSSGVDPHHVRSQFPILEERVHGKRLVWLDNAATTQKPRRVIDRLTYFYEHENSNIHRAAHTLAARATDAYEGARESVRRFVGARSTEEIIFVRGATEGINLVANAWGRANVGAGDEIVVTWLEHHANIVPWQQLCAATGAKLRVAPVDDRGQIQLDAYARLLGPRTKLAALTQVSNALGTITPVGEMTALAHRVGARVLIDGAQAVSHLPVDVVALDCDFYVFSGHKVFAPTGIGAVYGKREVLAAMAPWQGGGNMIADVTFEHTTFQGPPARFEAGTGNIADAVGLGAALDWLSELGVANVGAYEHALLEYATARLETVPGLRMIGTAAEKAGVLSFVIDGHTTTDLGKQLDADGIAVRSGHHCAQPILRRFGLEATVRASLAPYNTCDDVDALVASLHRIVG